ncbi:hypothetical protein [Lysobacter silvisoli]|uniref:Uncharacterized protein n=1 Tax=Lysobacter silvisoli TaxID=2293254 RepID=A0A371JZZ3_9GAMM|nr:hypothetical protein [Lysobacter silvisoli]RDZ27238.1 hypothetical protein DX914_13390 [Lysobacter silvisoli]
MLLDLDRLGFPMKRVFSLSSELESDPERVALTQTLTKDESRPFMGLKGTHGLFGSPEWWSNIELRNMPLLFVSGQISRAYVVSQDSCDANDTIDLIAHDGSIRSVGIYTNDERDVALFREGFWVEMVYALDELKSQPARDGGVAYSRVALEVAISLHPSK